MSALLLKDYYVIFRQMRIFLLLILVFSCIPGTFYSTFAVVYASMLPYTALAYDERSKWDQMAAMMPYSIRDIVLSKYLLGWVCSVAAGLCSMALQFVLTVLDVPTAALDPVANLIGLCGSMCVLAVTLPMMFRFGVERGRLALFLLIFLVCGGAGALGTITLAVDHTASGINGPFAFFMLILPAAALVLTAISIPLSVRMYQKKTI